MQLFEAKKTYSPKEIYTTMKISRETFENKCRDKLPAITFEGSKIRRYMGEDLNRFFNKSEL